MFIGNGIPGWNTLTANMKFTINGGLAVLVINKTGETSVKGKIVEAGMTIDNSVSLMRIDVPDPLGIILDAGISDGNLMWAVISGKVAVLYGTVVSRGTFARSPQTADGVAAGLAVAEASPTPPFSTDKHFMEIGHPLETIGAPGLALTALHFN